MWHGIGVWLEYDEKVAVMLLTYDGEGCYISYTDIH